MTDNQTGLYRLGVRWYDPATGRFTTPDPTTQETNPYLYAAGNPANLIDPTGAASSWKAKVLGSAAGIAAGVIGGGVGLYFGIAGAATGAYVAGRFTQGAIEEAVDNPRAGWGLVDAGVKNLVP